MKSPSHKKSIIIIFAGILFLTILALIQYNSGNSDTIEFSGEDLLIEAPGSKDLIAGSYVDNSMDISSPAIYTPEITLNKGFYTITVNYTSNVPSDLYSGALSSLKAYNNGIVLNPQQEICLLEESSTEKSYSFYVPYDNSQITIKNSCMESDDANEMGIDYTLFLNINSITIISNPKR